MPYLEVCPAKKIDHVCIYKYDVCKIIYEKTRIVFYGDYNR